MEEPDRSKPEVNINPLDATIIDNHGRFLVENFAERFKYEIQIYFDTVDLKDVQRDPDKLEDFLSIGKTAVNYGRFIDKLLKRDKNEPLLEEYDAALDYIYWSYENKTGHSIHDESYVSSNLTCEQLKTLKNGIINNIYEVDKEIKVPWSWKLAQTVNQLSV